MTTEPTIEQALAELREMFPELVAGQLAIVAIGYNVVVGKKWFCGITLSEAMGRVRAWHEQQSKVER